MKIKGYAIAKTAGPEILIQESTGCQKPSSDIFALLDQLLEPSSGYLKAAWNLDSFAAPLFKLLTPEICKQLASANHEVTFGDPDSETAYKIYYLPGTLMAITKNSGGNHARLRATIYGLDGFFADDQPEPDSVCSVEALGNKLLLELEKIGIIR